MKINDRLERIRERLTKALQPTYLEIIDDSHKHIGHAGAQGGAGHYTVIISAPDFQNQSRIASHQLIYQALGDMMGPEIHALSIKIR